VVSNTVTSSAGTWNVPSLIPGKYSVSIEAKGFRTLLRKDTTVLADHATQPTRNWRWYCL